MSDLTPDATRAFVSVGGNLPVASTHEALLLLGERVAKFEESYRSALAAVLERVPVTTLCTIYNGNLAEDQAPTARVALMLFNDVILRAAFQWRLPVIDLRLICTERADYANPIEPSGSVGPRLPAPSPPCSRRGESRPRSVKCSPAERRSQHLDVIVSTRGTRRWLSGVGSVTCPRSLRSRTCIPFRRRSRA